MPPVVQPRILIVEDETIVARDIQTQLQGLGYEPVGYATRGDNAIAMTDELRPDLVLMDIQLSGPMDGIMAAQIIRTRFGLPVVFLTAYATDETLARAKLTEPFGYLLKPFSVHELRIALEMALYQFQVETRLRIADAALKAVSQGVMICSKDQRIESANDAFLHITGYSEAEILGRTPDFFLGLRPDNPQLAELHAAPAEQREFAAELICYRKDGSQFWNELSVSPVLNAQGKLTHFISIIRDISARKLASEQTRELALHQTRVKEEERKRIAREIHDDLGGLLNGIKSYLSVLLGRAERAAQPVEPLLQDAAIMADVAIDALRHVITELRPSVLDQLGLWAALEWHASQIERRMGLKCLYTISDELNEITPDAEASTAAFRIVQELTQNVSRHAKASRITLRAEREAEWIRIEVQDDGIGIDANLVPGKDCWGIIGMHERAKQSGGKLMIANGPNGGTLAVLKLPLESGECNDK